MSATLAPQGLVPTRHPSGIIRQEQMVDGILSGLGSNIFTGTPIKRDTNGTLIPVTNGAADPCLGVFQGCQFTSAGKRFIIPYFPTGQTYDAGSMLVNFTADREIIYAGQAGSSIAVTARGEGINLLNNAQGSTFTGFSSQALGVATGATAATFTIFDLDPYDDNAWGDAFTRLLVKFETYQGPVA